MVVGMKCSRMGESAVQGRAKRADGARARGWSARTGRPTKMLPKRKVALGLEAPALSRRWHEPAPGSGGRTSAPGAVDD